MLRASSLHPPVFMNGHPRGDDGLPALARLVTAALSTERPHT